MERLKVAAEASFKFRRNLPIPVFEYDFLIFKNPNVETVFNCSAKSGANEVKKTELNVKSEKKLQHAE